MLPTDVWAWDATYVCLHPSCIDTNCTKQSKSQFNSISLTCHSIRDLVLLKKEMMSNRYISIIPLWSGKDTSKGASSFCLQRTNSYLQEGHSSLDLQQFALRQGKPHWNWIQKPRFCFCRICRCRDLFQCKDNPLLALFLQTGVCIRMHCSSTPHHSPSHTLHIPLDHTARFTAVNCGSFYSLTIKSKDNTRKHGAHGHR